jgi:hypothetical protein
VRGREKIQSRKIVLRQQPTYQVGKRLFHTALAAAKADAWAMILARYIDPLAGPNRLEQIQEAGGSECDCDYGNPVCCPLHSHEDGYFRRLHERLTRFLLAKMEVEP